MTVVTARAQFGEAEMGLKADSAVPENSVLSTNSKASRLDAATIPPVTDGHRVEGGAPSRCGRQNIKTRRETGEE